MDEDRSRVDIELGIKISRDHISFLGNRARSTIDLSHFQNAPRKAGFFVLKGQKMVMSNTVRRTVTDR